ncbi:MAG: GNAT family N-acetyltransferase [Dehalococcoidia bacterium]
MKGNITIRRLETNDEYLACLELQKSTWGEGFVDLASPAILKVGQRLGGVTAGAFDRWEKLVGFVFGLTGYRDGEPVHWSDMLAVRPEWRAMGIGKRLKLFQREEVMKLGVRFVFWTYDPLEALNANLNLNGLGVLIDEYVENMYATDEGPSLRSGLGTDRFVVRWPIAEERVLKTLQGELKPRPEEYSHISIVNTAIDAGGETDGCT